MSEPTPSSVAGCPADHRAKALTQETIEAVLTDFYGWLHQLAAEEQPDTPAADGAAEPWLDVSTLLSQFTALRHEVNLQTKAVRAQQELNAATLEQLSQAVETLQQRDGTAAEEEEVEEEAPQPGPADDEQFRPLLKTLVDLYDALAPAERESRRVQEAILPALEKIAAAPPAELAAQTGVPLWARWLGLQARVEATLKEQADRLGQQLRDEQQRRQAEVDQSLQQVRRLLEAFVTGYSMSLQRIDRALRQHGLEPIPTAGQPFDPERMEVIDIVTGSDRSPGEVVDEVRRGYHWRGRIFRYAQVRVAKA